MPRLKTMQQRTGYLVGFSLVELSIVLVILGLLTGGILAGQSLIRAAELRAVSVEYSRYVAATNSFRDKYFQLPGDFNNAAAFWTSLTTANNGNSDGILNNAAAVSTTGEIFQYWNEMALAGLIEGNYSGLAGSGGVAATVLGTNAPKSKLSGGGWGIYNAANYAGDAFTYKADYGNMLIFGAQSAGSIPLGGVLKPEEAWNIDTKMDDGRPGTGKVIPYTTVTWGQPTTCSLATGNTDYTSGYNLSSTTATCALYFARPF